MGRYKVVIADNFHYMDRDEYVDLGSYGSREAAVAEAMRVVDEWLSDALRQGVSVAELYQSYVSFGDDPFVVPINGGPGVHFSAWDYAKQRCTEIQSKKVGK